MTTAISRERESRVLVYAPTGRDGPLICSLLTSKGIDCTSTPTLDAACFELKKGAGVVVFAEEGLTPTNTVAWATQISEQPSWSDLPVILLTLSGEVGWKYQRRMIARQHLGNFVLLERPIRSETLLSTVQAALRTRARQYQLRESIELGRATEEALRKSEKLVVAGRLAASIAHEINNPLESITNLLYLIGISPSLDWAKQHAEVASAELARVSQIVTHTLSFYREPKKSVEVQFPEILDSALSLFQGRLAHAEIIVEKDFRECSPILAMEGELRQVILHLIGNALDALGRRGKLKLRVSNTHERNNGMRPGVRVSVADTGTGIESKIRDTLFEPFVSTRGTMRTGLGLWISSEIVRKHGGTIQVKSSTNPPTGTVFSIFLPIASTGIPPSVLTQDEGSLFPDGGDGRKCVVNSDQIPPV